MVSPLQRVDFFLKFQASIPPGVQQNGTMSLRLQGHPDRDDPLCPVPASFSE